MSPIPSPIPDHWERAGIGRGLDSGRTADYLPEDDAVSLEGSEVSTDPGTDTTAGTEVPPQLPDPARRVAAADNRAPPPGFYRPRPPNAGRPDIPGASWSDGRSWPGNPVGQATTSSPAATQLPCEGSQDYAYEPSLMVRTDEMSDEISEDGPLPQCNCSQMLSVGMEARTRGDWMSCGLYQYRPNCPLCKLIRAPGEEAVLEIIHQDTPLQPPGDLSHRSSTCPCKDCQFRGPRGELREPRMHPRQYGSHQKAGEEIMRQHKMHFEERRRAYATGEGPFKEAVGTNNPTFVHQPPPPESRLGTVIRASEADLPLLARRFLSEAKAEVTRLWQWKTTTPLGRTRVNNMINKVFHSIVAADFDSEVLVKMQALFSDWSVGLVRTTCEESFKPVTHPPAAPEPEHEPPPTLPEGVRVAGGDPDDERPSPRLPDWPRTPQQAAYGPIPMVDYPVGGTLITQNGHIPVREPPGDLIVYSYETTLDRLARALDWQRGLSPESYFLNSMGAVRGPFGTVTHSAAQVHDTLCRIPMLTCADRVVLLAGWHRRRALLLRWTKELPHKEFKYYSIPGPMLPTQPSVPRPASAHDVATAARTPVVPQQPPGPVPGARKTVAGNSRQKRQKLDFPEADQSGATAEERTQKTYEKVVHHIISETIVLCQQLTEMGCKSSPFGHVLGKKPDASPDDIATVYGQLITGRRGGGAVQLSGLKQRWSRIRRFLESVIILEDFGVLHTCRFIDSSNYKGFGAHLRWAGAAFHLDWLQRLAEQDIVKHRHPGKSWVPARGRLTNKAPHVPDDYLRYLADQCHDPSPIRRRKAFYLYQCGYGGVRFSDTEHVIRMEIQGDKDPQGRYLTGACIVFTASRFKTTRGEQYEQYALPLHDYMGRSLEVAVLDLQAQMGGEAGGFLLAAPLDARNIESDIRRDPSGRPMKGSYWASTMLMRQFVEEWRAALPTDSPLRNNENYAKATLHSFKGWLDTFAIQAGFQQDQIDTLLHWSNKNMRRHYNRHPQAVEVHLRQKVVALLAPASGWASAGVGSQMREPPVLSAVHPVQVTHQF